MARIRASTGETREPVTGWRWLPTAAGAVASARDLPPEGWTPIEVPGALLGALRSQNRTPTRDPAALDQDDHWWRARLATPLRGALRFEGVATISEFWIDGVKRADSQSMFQPIEIDVDLPAGADIAICCRALAPRLASAPRRSRWRPAMIQPNGLRWFRTTALGSMPGWRPEGRPIGPYRPIERIARAAGPIVRNVDVRSRLDGATGKVSIALDLAAVETSPRDAHVVCGDATAPLTLTAPGVLQGELSKPNAAQWFPHTHGDPALHRLKLVIDGVEIDLGSIGFRTIDIDRDADGQGFGLVINGVPVFCRGAAWSNADISALAGDRASYERWLRRARDAGMNMIRIPGVATYESDAFFDLCDELGLLVWQDMMLANFDYPQTDETFRAAVDAEAETLLLRTQTAPSLAVLCGGSEVFQQAAMLGAPPENWSGPIFDEVLPAAAKRLRPDIAYVPNSPSGGPLPFVANSGVTHYYGVGAYMRDLDDARRARVRFASECLAFANVPDEISLSAAGVPAIAHHPAWKQGVPRDFGASWDFEDVRDHYLERLYGASAMHLRRENPERYFALSRAVVAEVMEATYAEWRRPDSPTRGALVWMLQDLQPGAGWGVIASDGAPKSAWHALARAFRPVQIALTDEGVNGLAIHLTNERPFDIDARIELTCWRDGATPVARASWDQKLAARSAVSVSTFERIGSFFDISYAYRFGPPSHDATSVALVDATTGDKLAEAFHFPLGRGNAQRETKLAAQLEQNGDRWRLGISAARFAQSVHIVDEDWLPSDNWFHLTPGVVKWITLEPRGPKSRAPQGEVRAVNAIERAQYGA